MSRKGESYLGGHTILHGNGRVGLDKSTFGQNKFSDKLWSGTPGVRMDKKWSAWRERMRAIGANHASWPQRKKSLERRIQTAIKSGARTPDAIANAWNIEGYKTYDGGKWRVSLILMASKAVGMEKFLRGVSKSKPFRRVKKSKPAVRRPANGI